MSGTPRGGGAHLGVTATITGTGSDFSPGYRRQAVPLPRSLPEMQQAAALHLYSGRKVDRLRLFHKGREVHHAVQFGNIKEGDTVACRRDFNRVQPEADAPMVSTHQADLIPFGAVAPPLPLGSDDASVLTAISAGKPLAGSSLYKDDYVDHRVPKPEDGIDTTQVSHIKDFGDGDRRWTAYKTHFSWPEATFDPNDNEASRASTISKNTLGRRFQGSTCYRAAYNRPKSYRQPMPERASVDDSTSTLTDMAKEHPFKGASTYADHYVKFVDAERRDPLRPAAWTPRVQPLDSASEYRRQYHGHKAGRGPHVHIEADD